MLRIDGVWNRLANLIILFYETLIKNIKFLNLIILIN